MAGGLGAPGGVILEIALLCLTLDALFLLERLPAGTGLVAAAPLGGTGGLTGKHNNHSNQTIWRGAAEKGSEPAWAHKGPGRL